MIEAYPLTWPHGWKRHNPALRSRAKFTKEGAGQFGTIKGQLTVAQGVDRCMQSLGRMGVGSWNVIISTHIPTTRDGMPRSGVREPADPGVAVYWRGKDEKQLVLAIDRYDRVADNLAAIAATLEAMRAIERHGGAQILERAFTGFTALPAPGQTTARGWREVLGFAAGDMPKYSEVEAAYRRLRSSTHPDRPTGNGDLFIAVQTAFDQAHKELCP